jgi:hypothetical protein
VLSQKSSEQLSVGWISASSDCWPFASVWTQHVGASLVHVSIIRQISNGPNSTL